MAGKRTIKKTEVNEVVDTNVVDGVDTVDEGVDTTSEDLEVADTATDEVLDDATNTEVEDLVVDTTPTDVDNAPKAKTVRVKLNKDIDFNFGSERYELKKGHCYNVPISVKLHLNKFNALSPL